MKNILGLDLGTTSIGWALVREAENDSEKSEIVKLGVRLVPLTTDEKTEFEKGKSITTNADRRLKRSFRRNLQRYKFRRQELITELKAAGWIDALRTRPLVYFQHSKIEGKSSGRRNIITGTCKGFDSNQ